MCGVLEHLEAFFSCFCMHEDMAGVIQAKYTVVRNVSPLGICVHNLSAPAVPQLGAQSNHMGCTY